MTGGQAKNLISQIDNLCNEINHLDEKICTTYDTEFLHDACILLCEYKRTLEHEIEIAELRI